MLTPAGASGMEKLVSERRREREDHFCFPRGSCVTESRTVAGGPEGGGRLASRRGSDTSSCFEGRRPRPGHLPAAPPSLLPDTAFSSEFFLLPSALFIFGLPLRKGWGRKIEKGRI